jgi:uncharacterized protein
MRHRAIRRTILLTLLGIVLSAVAQAAAPDRDRALLDAARRGDIGGMVAALANGAQLAARTDDRNGNTALHLAARHGHAPAISFLMDRNAPVDGRSKDGWTPLMQASFAGHGTIIQQLIKAGADIEARDPRHGNTPLIIASGIPRNLDAVTELLASGASVNAAAKDGRTPLLAAARRGLTPVIDLLLSEKPDVEVRTADGNTALILVAYTGRTRALRALLRAGADPNMRAADGVSALTRAALSGDQAAVAGLLAAKASPNGLGRDDRPALHQAAKGGHVEILRILLDGGADVNLTDGPTGQTALMLAANSGSLRAVELLLARGAKTDLRAKDGWTALEAAKMAGGDRIAAALRAAGPL